MRHIPLTRGKYAAIDDEDYAFVSQWKWTCSSKGYAYRREGPKQLAILLHRVIAERAGCSMANQIDHIDQDKVNCRRDNLRSATNSQNQANSKKPRHNTSGYKGVTWNKSRHKWQAQIRVHGKQITLGRYSDKLEAYAAYCDAQRRYFGAFACAG